MATNVKDLTRPESQEKEWPEGTHGYFWANSNYALHYARYGGKTDGGHIAKSLNGEVATCAWKNFSPTLPDWAKPKEELKPEKGIEFVSYINRLGETQGAELLPKDFQNIEILVRNYGKYDVFYAYSEDWEDGVLYLGHANSGKVL
jgi:hypothetical protein